MKLGAIRRRVSVDLTKRYDIEYIANRMRMSFRRITHDSIAQSAHKTSAIVLNVSPALHLSVCHEAPPIFLQFYYVL